MPIAVVVMDSWQQDQAVLEDTAASWIWGPLPVLCPAGYMPQVLGPAGCGKEGTSPSTCLGLVGGVAPALSFQAVQYGPELPAPPWPSHVQGEGWAGI